MLLLTMASTAVAASSGTAWPQYGPDRAGGLFFNITRDHTIDTRSAGLAIDGEGRLLVLNDWRSTDLNRDCALTRHLPLARHLDMDFTGPDGLEGTQRIALDAGGFGTDRCRGVLVDAFDRPVVYGHAATDFSGNTSGFVLRLREDGAVDTGFASNTGVLPPPTAPGTLTRTELYLHCDGAALEAALARATQLGARVLSTLAPRPWGDEAAYLCDPEGNTVVLARRNCALATP